MVDIIVGVLWVRDTRVPGERGVMRLQRNARHTPSSATIFSGPSVRGELSFFSFAIPKRETTHLGRRGFPGSLFTELGYAAYAHEEKIQ